MSFLCASMHAFCQLTVENDLNVSDKAVHERTIMAPQLICKKRSFAHRHRQRIGLKEIALTDPLSFCCLRNFFSSVKL
jgi:hypothetical protein